MGQFHNKLTPVEYITWLLSDDDEPPTPCIGIFEEGTSYEVGDKVCQFTFVPIPMGDCFYISADPSKTPVSGESKRLLIQNRTRNHFSSDQVPFRDDDFTKQTIKSVSLENFASGSIENPHVVSIYECVNGTPSGSSLSVSAAVGGASAGGGAAEPREKPANITIPGLMGSGKTTTAEAIIRFCIKHRIPYATTRSIFDGSAPQNAVIVFLDPDTVGMATGVYDKDASGLSFRKTAEFVRTSTTILVMINTSNVPPNQIRKQFGWKSTEYLFTPSTIPDIGSTKEQWLDYMYFTLKNSHDREQGVSIRRDPELYKKLVVQKSTCIPAQFNRLWKTVFAKDYATWNDGFNRHVHNGHSLDDMKMKVERWGEMVLMPLLS
jgi:hypothetical protein